MESSPLKLDTSRSLGSLHSVVSVAEEVNDLKGQETRVGGPRSHGMCLTLNDHEHIRQFIQEFTFRGLLPHIEKNIRQLNDQVPLTLHNLITVDDGIIMTLTQISCQLSFNKREMFFE